jgi:D-alanyl-D-alanine carboxypeptidase
MSRPWTTAAIVMIGMVGAAGCASTADGATAVSSTMRSSSAAEPTSEPPPVTTAIATTTTPSESSSTSTSTSGTSTTSTSTSTTSTSTSTTVDNGPVTYSALQLASAGLVEGNLAVSVSVWRDGVPDFEFAHGQRVDGRPIDTESPFVIASVSKLVTALSIARLVEDGRIELLDPVPWEELDVRHDPAWNSITVRQLLAHTSGMPVARKTWLDDPGQCTVPLQQAMALPPTDSLGEWRYSNGNYCALGLLVEHVTGLPLDEAAYRLVFEPASIAGPFLSTDGYQPDAVPYVKGLARLQRLGGAGTWLASTDDIAAMLSAVTDDDLVTLQWPGIIVDQYGWGHTGSVDGAEACAWTLHDGRTVVTAFVSGSKPNTGGEVCDVVIVALAIDLGVYAGEPIRNPL